MNKNNNFNEKLSEMIEAFKSSIVPFYKKIACPCSFPRLLYLLDFDSRKIIKRSSYLYETQFFVENYMTQSNGEMYSFIKDECREISVCNVCKSKFLLETVDGYKNDFHYVIKVLNLRAPVLGEEVSNPFPLLIGSSKNRTKIENVGIFQINHSVEVFVEYMNKVKNA